jgi:hypothetical protein
VIWRIVEETGWTLEYINDLPFSKIAEWIQVKDGTSKGRNSLFNKKGK